MTRFTWMVCGLLCLIALGCGGRRRVAEEDSGTVVAVDQGARPLLDGGAGTADFGTVECVFPPRRNCQSGCVDVLMDNNNCGDCGNRCEPGFESCLMGSCVPAERDAGPIAVDLGRPMDSGRPVDSGRRDSGSSTPVEGQLRIAAAEGGVATNRGRLIVYHAGEWGTICDDNWDVNPDNANVACQQLGYSGGTQYTDGAGFGTIWMDDVDCLGTESALVDCPFDGFGVDNCTHTEDVGVDCF